SYGRAKPTELNEAQRIHVERRLSVCPGVRGTDLHAELRYEYSYAGSYPAFQRNLRLLRPAEVKDPEIRFETGPGLQTQADWAKPSWPPRGSTWRRCWRWCRRPVGLTGPRPRARSSG